MTARELGVYVHFPWCLRKCPYCDFATRGAERDAIPSARYADAVIRELGARPEAIAGRALTSVFFGGGTPSLWEPAELGRVLRAIVSAFGVVSDDLEVTAECNPSSLDERRAAELVAVGVNRLSVGVQSLDDDRLRFLGRLHDAQGALAAVRAARSAAPRASADVIFGVARETADDAARDVERLLDEGLTHVSAYALTIEPGTQFGELDRRGRLPRAIEDDVADAFLAIESVAGRFGLGHYEVSNYAVPGEEARHNVHVWRGGEYLGLGAAAVGAEHLAVGRAHRRRNEPDPERYMAGAPPVEEELLDADTMVREALLLGLRTDSGVDLASTEARTGLDVLAGRRERVARVAARGDAILDADRLRVPRERWLVLDAIVRDVF